jgi:2-haloacid dehalogenase/putative hydrolase of the HAD superfamily
MAWHAEADRGLPFAENIRRLAAQHPWHREAIEAWWARWPEMFSGAIPETEAAIEALHAAGRPLFGLTNMSLEAWPGVEAMSPAFQRFSDVVISAAEGLIKPDPELFLRTCDRIGYAPRELLFIDDSLANIQAAERLGFHVHRFENPAALGRVLRSHALL